MKAAEDWKIKTSERNRGVLGTLMPMIRSQTKEKNKESRQGRLNDGSLLQ